MSRTNKYKPPKIRRHDIFPDKKKQGAIDYTREDVCADCWNKFSVCVCYLDNNEED